MLVPYGVGRVWCFDGSRLSGAVAAGAGFRPTNKAAAACVLAAFYGVSHPGCQLCVAIVFLQPNKQRLMQGECGRLVPCAVLCSFATLRHSLTVHLIRAAQFHSTQLFCFRNPKHGIIYTREQRVTPKDQRPRARSVISKPHKTLHPHLAAYFNSITTTCRQYVAAWVAA